MNIRITLIGAAVALAPSFLAAGTLVYDFSSQNQYNTNFTETKDGGYLSVNEGTGVLEMNSGNTTANSIAIYNSPFPTPAASDFSVSIDGKSSILTTSLSGTGFGLLTNLTNSTGSGTGYLAIFRIAQNNTSSSADLRIWENAKGDGSSLGNLRTTLNFSGTSLFAADTFYTFNLDVDVTEGSSIAFIGSIRNATTGTVIATFDTYTDSSPSIGSTSAVGIRLASQGNLNVTTADNLTLTTSTIPEPSAFALLGGAGVLGLALVRRRRRD